MSKGYIEKLIYKKGYISYIDCIVIKGTKIGATSVPHNHRYIEILFAEKMDGEVWINDNDVYEFKTGDIIIVHADETHNIFSKHNDYEYLVIKFFPEIFLWDGQTPDEYKYLDMLSRNKINISHRIPFGSHSEEMFNIARKMHKEWNEEKFGFEIALRSGAFNLFLNIIRYINDNIDSESVFLEENSTIYLIYNAARRIKSDFTNITSSELAKECAMSYSHFSRMFKKVMGITFSDYLTEVRIEHAKKLLSQTSLTISEISKKSGFSSVSYFISIFKKTTKTLPNKYRQNFNK